MPTLLAPAKINATLEILSRREDGHHNLRSVMLPIALYDRIEIEPASAQRFSSSDPALANDNLVARALARCGLHGLQSATLHKAIPVGGGLGGGSSDAAAVIAAAMKGELGPHDPCDWLAIARGLGSDVPFFLGGTGALVEGTGERVTPIATLPDWWLVVARPHAAVATADAYRMLAARRASGEDVPDTRPRSTSASLAVVDALQRRDFAAFEGALQNDFHAPILAAYPEVARADAALCEAGARRVLLSGSGSCLFAAFERECDARATAESVSVGAEGAVESAFVVGFHHDAAWR